MNLEDLLQSMQDITKDLPVEGNEYMLAAVAAGIVALYGLNRYRKRSAGTSKKSEKTDTSSSAPTPKKRKRKEPTLGEIQAKLREEKRARLQQRPKTPTVAAPSVSPISTPSQPDLSANVDNLQFSPLSGAAEFPNYVQVNRDGSPDLSPFDSTLAGGSPVAPTSAPSTSAEKIPDLFDIDKVLSSIQPISDATTLDPATEADTNYVLGVPSSPILNAPSQTPVAFAVDPVEIEVLRTPLGQSMEPIDIVPVLPAVAASQAPAVPPAVQSSPSVSDDADVLPEKRGWFSRLFKRRASEDDDIFLDMDASRTDMISTPVEGSPAPSPLAQHAAHSSKISVGSQASTPLARTPSILDPTVIRETSSPAVQELIDHLILKHEQRSALSATPTEAPDHPVAEEIRDPVDASADPALDNAQNIPVAIVEIEPEEPVEIELPWELEVGLHLDHAKPLKRLTSQLRKTQYSLKYEPRDVWYIVGHQYRVHYATTFGLWTERDVQIQYMIQGKNNMWLSTICLDTQRHYFVDTSRIVQAWDLTDSVLVYSGIRSDLISSNKENWWMERTLGVTKELLRLTRDDLAACVAAEKEPIEIAPAKFQWAFWKRFTKASKPTPNLDNVYSDPILDLDVMPTGLMRYQPGLSKNVSWNALALCLRWIASHYPSALNHSGTYVLEMLHRLHDNHHIDMEQWLNLQVDEEAFIQCVDYLMRVNYGVGHVLLIASVNLHAAQEAWAVHHRDNIGALDRHHESMWYIEQRFWEYYRKSPV